MHSFSCSKHTEDFRSALGVRLIAVNKLAVSKASRIWACSGSFRGETYEEVLQL